MSATDSNAQNSNALQLRLAKFGGRVLGAADDLPSTHSGRHLRDQLSRAATAPGAHYAEARSAQSRADFIHKVALAAKEAREALYWLRVAEHAELADSRLDHLIGEADEIVAILFTSLQTARENRDD
ncbi:MAG: four helix bundle protein [Bradymonadaceae bacterium]